MINLKIYSDGCCKNNPGLGGYGTIIKKYDDDVLLSVEEFIGRNEHTTNNRMELMGVVSGLVNSNTFNVDVVVVTDSEYVVKSFEEGWINNWKKNNWMRYDPETKSYIKIKNDDLWKALDSILNLYTNYKFVWVKGHDGHAENERCDYLANIAAAGEYTDKVKECKNEVLYEVYKTSNSEK